MVINLFGDIYMRPRENIVTNFVMGARWNNRFNLTNFNKFRYCGTMDRGINMLVLVL